MRRHLFVMFERFNIILNVSFDLFSTFSHFKHCHRFIKCYKPRKQFFIWIWNLIFFSLCCSSGIHLLFSLYIFLSRPPFYIFFFFYGHSIFLFSADFIFLRLFYLLFFSIFLFFLSYTSRSGQCRQTNDKWTYETNTDVKVGILD